MTVTQGKVTVSGLFAFQIIQQARGDAWFGWLAQGLPCDAVTIHFGTETHPIFHGQDKMRGFIVKEKGRKEEADRRSGEWIRGQVDDNHRVSGNWFKEFPPPTGKALGREEVKKLRGGNPLDTLVRNIQV